MPAGWGQLLVIAGLVAMLPVWTAFFGQYLDSREAETKCASAAPSNAVLVGDTYRFDIDRTFFPAGRQCIYDMQDGTTLAVQTGSVPTTWALIGSAACLAVVVITWIRWQRLSAIQRLLPHVALALAVLAWASIAWFAALG